MINCSNESICELRLVGGTMKLCERPSSSTSSLPKKHTSRIHSRPSSAFPRLCCEEKIQEEISLMKSERRPFSADFQAQSLLSRKSKETLTDGSFESVYVPVDFHLPSSNLFKELLNEDIEEWRRSGEHASVDLEKAEDKNSNIEREQSRETQDKSDSVSTNKIESIGGLVDASQEGSDTSVISKNNDIIFTMSGTDENADYQNGCGENKYLLTPGLTSKPPLPKKVGTFSTNHDNAIYDYFSIKYDVESGALNSQTAKAEKPICEEMREELDTLIGKQEMTLLDNDRGRKKMDAVNQEESVKNFEESEEKSTDCVKMVEIFEEPKADEDFDLNSTLKSWLDEVNINKIQEEESETDRYLKEVRQHCGNYETDPLRTDAPFLSEMNIDDLFETGGQQGFAPETNEPKPDVSMDDGNLKNSSKKGVGKKKVKGSVKPHQSKNNSDETVISKRARGNRIGRGKFVPTVLKTVDSPRMKNGSVEDNIETWIGKDGVSRRKRAEFKDLIGTVEDLKSTTEIICSDFPACDRISQDNKQHNFDELETIIEALEHQDKTSQNSIKTMKKIVTSELSNSVVLNENDGNLPYRKKENVGETFRIEITSNTPDSMTKHENNGSDVTTPVEFGMDTQRSLPDGKTEVKKPCNHHKIDSVKQDVPGEIDKNRQLSQNGFVCGDFAKPRECAVSQNYRDLLSYLDEVDKKCTKTLEIAKERAETASKLVLQSSNLFDTIPKVEDLLTYTQQELASYVIDLSLRVKDKSSCINLLQSELNSFREKLLMRSKQAETMLRQKLKEQKEETEKIAKRHQKFIDQLMEEKKTLARRCEELVEEMTSLEDKYVSNMKAIEHKHQVEMQKLKDMHAASEKLRRERWIEGRTQKIKEMAVKSIEPEVERMEKRHQEEISNLRSMHKREIEEMELRASRKLQEHSEKLRDQLIQDREKALAHERDVMRLRYEKLVESEERNYQEQRRRLLADHSNRVAECEEREAQAAAEKERAIKQAQEEFEEKLQAATRRHNNEMKLVKETAAIEMENWKNSFRKQQSALLLEKETLIRRECRKERDREIEIVIERLETESNKAKAQIEQTTENRIKRLREKYEAEIRDLELLEKDAQNKYSEARSKLVEYEDVILTLRATLKQLENQLTEESLKRGRLENEREEIRQTIRKEYEDKMQSLEAEVEELRSSSDKQVEQLYSRVRVSLARKDELLTELSNDHKALKEKCIYLENMIEQQRKEFMINS